MNGRKIKQLVAMYERNLVALCEDNTLWVYDAANDKWVPLVGIPVDNNLK